MASHVPSIIQTRRAKTQDTKEGVVTLVLEEPSQKASTSTSQTAEEELVGGTTVQHQDEEEQEARGATVEEEMALVHAEDLPEDVKAQLKRGDSHVQITMSGERPAKIAKLDTGDVGGEEYVIIEQHGDQVVGEGEAMEGEELEDSQYETNASDVGGGSEMDMTPRGGKKMPQKYRKQWETHELLKNWLAPLPGNSFRAWCRQCGCPLITQLKVLVDHAKCRKHQRREGRPLQDAPVQLGGRLGHQQAGTWGRKDNNQLDVSYGDADRVTYSIGLGTQKVGFIGAGKISQAIAQGLMNKGLTSSSCIMASSPSDRNQAIWKRWKCKTMHDNSALVRQCDVVFLAVAPADLEAVLNGLEPPGDNVERCFISTVSGVSGERLTQMLSEVMPDEQVFVIRCVPSKTVSIGEGVCVYSAPADLPHTWLLTMETIFSALGLCQKVEEHVMNVHSGAFSSGPAYVAAFIDALATGAANHGVRWEDAVQMAAQVTQGTAAMILTQGVTPATLKRDCSAPGGNTIAGLMALHKGGMEFAVMSAVDEATKKAKELGAEQLQ